MGVYDSEKEAALAYDLSAVRHFGKGAKLNFPERVANIGIEDRKEEEDKVNGQTRYFHHGQSGGSIKLKEEQPKHHSHYIPQATVY